MWTPPFILKYFNLAQLCSPMLVLQLVVVENSVKPGESGFPKGGNDHSADGGEEGRLSERMGEEEWEQSKDEGRETEWNEIDERDGEEEGDDRGGEKERCVRRLIGQMGEDREDCVVYVGTTKLSVYSCSGEMGRRTRSP